MIPEIGHFALILALCVAVVQGILPIYGAAVGNSALMAVAKPAARGQFLLVLTAFCCLGYAFASKDFSVLYVAATSNSQLPLHYRLAAIWGAHEGSLLLWTFILTIWMFAVTLFSAHLPDATRSRILGVMGLVSVGFLLFMLTVSNPFERLIPAALDGRDLNPLLQDPGMVIHPPMLYMGYVGFSVAFAFAVAALLSGRLDAAWARWSRPWTIAAWIFLTLGIALGSYWAYYELGWGGWWFWDPVENASFMPWLVGTALVHSLAVTEKRGAFKSWTVLLAIAAFSLSLLGTFLVRSGVLTSVHAFATDPRRGLFILALLVLVIGVSLLLFAWRAPRLMGGGSFQAVSRETALLVNNVLLSVAAASVLLGTLYPLFVDALGLGKISVGPPYFEAVFVPLMVPVVLLMVVGPFIRWKGHALGGLARKLGPDLGVSLAIGIGMAWATGVISWRMVLGMALAAWVVIASLHLLKERLAERPGAPTANRLRGIPAAWWGMWLAHLGIAMFILGVTLVKGMESNVDVKMQPGDVAHLAGYSFTLKDVHDYRGPNFDAARADLEVARDGKPVALLHPEKRTYRAAGMPMTEASIDVNPLRDLYASMGEPLDAKTWIVRLYYKPFISWIWTGCLMMALGGVMAAADRRYRRLAERKVAVGAAQAVKA